MTYNITSALSVKSADKNFIEAGIHENISLDGIRVEKSVNGNNFIEIKLTNESGAAFTHTEYEPSRSTQDTDETFNNKATNQFARLLQLAKVFYTIEQLNSTAATFNNFEGMGAWFKQLIDGADKSKKMRVKIVYNDNGYTTLPRYAKYTFIEPMTVTKEESKIKPLSIDKFTRPEIVADKEVATTNPLFPNAGLVNSSTEHPFGAMVA